MPLDTDKKQVYSKKSLNKWHLLLRLSLNKELIDHRKKAWLKWKIITVNLPTTADKNQTVTRREAD